MREKFELSLTSKIIDVMTPYQLSKYKYSQKALSNSSVNSQQLSQFQYDGWKLAGWKKPYRIKDGDKSDCGKWVCYGCLRIENHCNNLTTNNTGPVVVKPTKYNCNRLSCSECHTRASYFRSIKIDKRIKSFQKQPAFFTSPDPLIETHIIVSPNMEIQDTFESIRSKVTKLLLDVGVVGGVLIVHHFRCEDRKYTKNGLHFHCVGYAPKGKVDGLEVKRQFRKWKCIVKNKGPRKSVRKTVSYLLSHCSVKEGKHSITWFGKLSYSQLKNPSATEYDIKELEKIRCCPMCQERLVRLDYVGTDRPPTEIIYDDISNWKRYRKST